MEAVVSKVFYDNKKQQYILCTWDAHEIQTPVCIQTTKKWKQVLVNTETNKVLTAEYDNIKLKDWIVIVENNWLKNVLRTNLLELSYCKYYKYLNIKKYWNVFLCTKQNRTHVDVYYNNFQDSVEHLKILFIHWNLIVAIYEDSFYYFHTKVLYVFCDWVYKNLEWIAIFLWWKKVFIINNFWSILDINITNVFWEKTIKQDIVFNNKILSIDKNVSLYDRSNFNILTSIQPWEKDFFILSEIGWTSKDFILKNI